MNVGKRGLLPGAGLLLAVSLGACAHHHGHAHGEGPGKHGHGTIVVTGVGEARGAPDLARTSIGVEVRAASVQEAMQQANAQMTNLTRVLKEQGIADGDLRTHGFSVSYDREYPQPIPMGMGAEGAAEAAARPVRATGGKKAAVAESAPAEPAPAPAPQPAQPRGSFVVHNQLEVTIRDVSKLGAVLSAATGSGANNIWGINFDLADKRPLLDKAREQAVAHAKADAERIAALSGVKLGKITMVSDGAAEGGVRPMFAGAERAMAADSVPVQQGELTVSHQVTLHYAIERQQD